MVLGDLPHGDHHRRRTERFDERRMKGITASSSSRRCCLLDAPREGLHRGRRHDRRLLACHGRAGDAGNQRGELRVLLGTHIRQERSKYR